MASIVVEQGRSGNNFNQFLSTTIINIMMLNYGCTLGWISPTALLLQSRESPLGVPVLDETMSWVVSVICLGALVGTPAYGYLADAIGRRAAAFATAVPCFVSWLLILLSPTVWSLILGRILAGVSAAGCLVVTPMFVAEISDPRCRGALGAIFMFMHMIGILLGYLSGGLLDYKTSIAVFLTLPVLTMLGLYFTPETPAYLVKRDKIDEATKALAWLKGLDGDDKEVISEISRLQVEKKANDAAPKISLRIIINNPGTRRAFTMLAILLSIQGFTGAFALINYVGTIFEAASAGASEDISAESSHFMSFLTSNTGSSLVIGLTMILGAFCTVLLVEKSGRKPLLIGSMSCMAICMTSLGVFFYLREHHPDIFIPGWLPVPAVSMALFGNSVGIGSVPWVIMSEVFSFRVRSALSVVLLMIVWIAAFAQIKVFTPLVNVLGFYGALWVFTAVNVFGVIYTIFYIPETKGRTLEDIARELGYTEDVTEEENENV